MDPMQVFESPNSVRTLAPVAAPIVTLQPEWMKIPDAVRLYGLGRSSLYELMLEGKVKSAVIRKRNAQRGLRLVNRESLSAYINAHAVAA